ncbi:MAG: putative nicotinate-nucleotide adenylyltransferase [Firmicutes bacterium ADurb.Bin193]|nr:MAG: putative nicotinate-nucleotide adenylyltransferase [Firmicutes bacterium ADurb.Bin193]
MRDDFYMQTDQIRSALKETMSEARFAHCEGVAKEAKALALHYGADAEKAVLAGLAHDCVKELDFDEMFKLCEKYRITLDSITKEEKKLIHAVLGAEYAKRELGIDDPEIYDAIRYHTTAKADMPLLTKIVYVADYTEEGRTFAGVDEIRKTSYINLDLAVLEGLDYTIAKLLRNKRMLHPETVNARNYILLKQR